MRALRVLREQRSFEIEDVAAYTKIAATSLADFERGIRTPSIKQINRLSNLYNVKSFALFSDQIPNTAASPMDFRKKDPVAAKVSPGGLTTVWRCENTSVFTSQLAREIKADQYLLQIKGKKFNIENPSSVRDIFDNWEKSKPSISNSVEVNHQSF